ncbi:catechol 2,3-dioxygenase [Enterococcus sp. DIV0840]|uniref:VOC family protein n=1 Tax=Enterococcus TaxID=1350 RepID=UPI001A8D5709|nr:MULTISPECIES: VOC family protein [Enterococcus]MBO0435239.1 VOC family protein [Enterococcus sp. DIV0849a]MBO0474459.1 VOC family protein [Enterococcus ureasiticus]
MEKFQLSQDVYVKTIALRVNDVEKMVSFYKNVLGFILKLEENNLSIFGSQEKDSRLLILEETVSEEDQKKTFEKSVCFSLLIPTEEEFGSLLRRITTHNYPISKSVQKGQRQSVFLEDPEGNKLEISYQGSANQYKNEAETLDVQPLIDRSNVLYSSLSAKVRFVRLKLGVKDNAKHHTFYRDILGMVSESKTADRLSLHDRNFWIHLGDSIEQDRQIAGSEESLGLDFFVLTVNHEEEMKKLKQHLEDHKQEFFVDKKLTIYDPSEIEWWFVRN